MNSFLGGPTVADGMFTRTRMVVNRLAQHRFELLGSRVQIGASIGSRLRGKLDYSDVGPDVLGEPVAVDAQVDVRDICANPASPIEHPSLAHEARSEPRLRSGSAGAICLCIGRRKRHQRTCD